MSLERYQSNVYSEFGRSHRPLWHVTFLPTCLRPVIRGGLRTSGISASEYSRTCTSRYQMRSLPPCDWKPM